MPQVDWIEANRESLKSAIQKPWTGLFDSGRISHRMLCAAAAQRHKPVASRIIMDYTPNGAAGAKGVVPTGG